ILGLVILCGLAAIKMGISVAHKVYKKSKEPVRYDPTPMVNDLNGPTINTDYKVFVASSLDRIFQDGKTLLKPSYSIKASISAARNEYESFQIVVHSSSKDLTSVVLKASDLTNSKTTTNIPKNNIELKVVRYVPTEKPYYPVKFVGP